MSASEERHVDHLPGPELVGSLEPTVEPRNRLLRVVLFHTACLECLPSSKLACPPRRGFPHLEHLLPLNPPFEADLDRCLGGDSSRAKAAIVLRYRVNR
jgi:hypothetical protein